VWKKKTVTDLTGSDDDVPIHSQSFGFYDGDLYFVTDHWDSNAGEEGTGRQFGVVWKSEDKGESWSQALSYPQHGGNANIAGTYPSTFCFAATFNGKLYVQLASFSCKQYPNPNTMESDVYDGNTWSKGPSLIPTQSVTVKARNFKDILILNHSGSLYIFDGFSTFPAFSRTIIDYTVSDGEVYILRYSGEVCRTKDLITYNCFDSALPLLNGLFNYSASIEVLGDFIYLGTTDARIFKAPIPNRASSTIPVLYHLLLD